MTALHCKECDSTECPGFARPATVERIPDLRPGTQATPAQRAAHLQRIRQELAAIKHREQEAGR